MGDVGLVSSVELPVLGLVTRFETDHPALADAVSRAYAGGAAAETIVPAAVVRLRLSTGGVRDEAARIVVDGSRLVLSGVARGEADAMTHTAWAEVPESLLHDPPRLAEDVLDTLTLFLLTRAGRIPLHAAGILIGQTAAVLAGRSGTGKSTLALAARSAGLTVLSDDAVYVQLEPRPRLWALRRPLHVPPPALSALRLTHLAGPPRLRRGRWKHALSAPEAPPGPVDCACLVLLRRGRSVSIRPVPTARVERELARTLEPGFDDFRESIPAVARALTSAGAWRLTLSDDPAAAVAALWQVLRTGPGPSGGG